MLQDVDVDVDVAVFMKMSVCPAWLHVHRTLGRWQLYDGNPA